VVDVTYANRIANMKRKRNSADGEVTIHCVPVSRGGGGVDFEDGAIELLQGREHLEEVACLRATLHIQASAPRKQAKTKADSSALLRNDKH